MSKDLISRKYVVKELLKEREHFPPMVAERYSFGVKLPHRFNQAMRGGIRKALRIAEQAPAVDAESVRHGEWIPSSIDPCDPYFRCSVCNQGYSTIYHDGEEMNYCPNCGADMRGDKDAAD